MDYDWEDKLYFANKVYNYHRKLNHSASAQNAPGSQLDLAPNWKYWQQGQEPKASKVKRNQQPGLCNPPSQFLRFSIQGTALAKDNQQQVEVEVGEAAEQSD